MIIVYFFLFYLGAIVSLLTLIRSKRIYGLIWTENLRDSIWFQFTVFLFCFFSGGLISQKLMSETPRFQPLFVLVLLGPGACIYALFFAYAIGHHASRIYYHALGGESLSIKYTYDKPEALIKRGELQKALDEYSLHISEHPDDLECKRRIAELKIKMGRKSEGVEELTNLIPLIQDEEKKLFIAFRSSDIFVEQGEIQKARDVLNITEKQITTEKAKQKIYERLKSLKMML